jgi:hypothetical protein
MSAGVHLGTEIASGTEIAPAKPPSLQSRSRGLIEWLSRNATADGLFPGRCCEMKPLYHFLSDHHINGVTHEAGSEHEMAPDWQPSGNVEPLNSAAVQAFHRAGPQHMSGVTQRWHGKRVKAPATYWVRTPQADNPSVERWHLAGPLGEGLAPHLTPNGCGSRP